MFYEKKIVCIIFSLIPYQSSLNDMDIVIFKEIDVHKCKLCKMEIISFL